MAPRKLDKTLLLPVITGLAILILWQAAVLVLAVPVYILPTPLEIAARVVGDLTSGAINNHFVVTATEVVAGIGFASLFGIAIGTSIALFPVVDRSVYPILTIIQTVPKVAVAPLIIIWFGYGISSKIATASLIAFFPILVNVIAGIKAVDPQRIMLMRALNGTATQVFLKVRLPNMMPFLLAGLQVAVVLAIIGAVVGEFVGASAGLGSLIIRRQASMDVSGVFSVLVYLSSMGLVLTMAIRTAGRKLVFWT
jgi:NitT/TauT family transport system permease protein